MQYLLRHKVEIRSKPLSLPGKDILYGIDQLIQENIVDPHRLTIGGYSYGGLLTNWLITQTQRFNAAVSGASLIEHVSGWGTMGTPGFHKYFFQGFPWENPLLYQNESPIYYFNQLKTPTHIVAAEKDTQISLSQSYIFHRALFFRNISTKLIIFPNEGHLINSNPIHGKIKIREELKWLNKYRNQTINSMDLFNKYNQLYFNYILQFIILILLYI
ncbi:hypothetical protein I4U23_000217 [Adineta vaga]|nr:hypothetical protein I4U23_000217 [Adineta vaga]